MGGFSDPEDMAIDKDGNFYVTDTGADWIMKFDQNFNFISEFGSVGDGPGEFDHPHGIGVDSLGNLYGMMRLPPEYRNSLMMDFS